MGEVARGIATIGGLSAFLGLQLLGLALIGRGQFDSLREWWES